MRDVKHMKCDYKCIKRERKTLNEISQNAIRTNITR